MEYAPVEHLNTFYESNIGSIFAEIDSINVPIMSLNKDFIKDVYVDHVGVNYTLVDNYDPEVDAYSAIITLPQFDSDMNPISWTLELLTSALQPDINIVTSTPNTPPFYLNFPKTANSDITEEWNKIALLKATGTINIDGKTRIPRVSGVSDSDETAALFLNYEYSHDHIALIGNSYNNPNHLKQTKMGQPVVKYKTFTDLDIISPEGFCWSNDGLKSFIADNGSNAIYEFTTNSAYTIKTLTSTNNQFSFNIFQISNPLDIASNSTGNIIHILDNSKRKISQFELTEPFDITTMRFNASYFEDPKIRQDSFVSKDGNWYYSLDNDHTIHSFKLTTPYKISTAEYHSSHNLDHYLQRYEYYGYPTWHQQYYCNAQIITYRYQYAFYTETEYYSRYDHLSKRRAICFSSDGLHMYAASGIAYNNGEIKKYDLTIPWDITTLSLAQTAYHEIGIGMTNKECAADPYRVEGVYGMRISDDGSSIYFLNTSNNTVYRYNFEAGHEYDLDYLTTDLKMNSAPQSFTFSKEGGNSVGIELLDNKLYITSETKIRQYDILNDNISNATLVDSASYTEHDYSLSTIVRLKDSNNNNDILYLQQNGKMYQYTVDSNLNSATFEYPLNDKEFYLDHDVNSFYISDDNKKVYTLDNTTNKILKYERQDSTAIGGLVVTSDSYNIPSIYGTNWQTLEIEETAGKLYLGGDGIIQQFGFDSNLNLSYEKLLVLTGNTKSIEDVKFNDSGNTILILGKNNISIDQYSTGIPYEIGN